MRYCKQARKARPAEPAALKGKLRELVRLRTTTAEQVKKLISDGANVDDVDANDSEVRIRNYERDFCYSLDRDPLLFLSFPSLIMTQRCALYT